MERNGPEKSWTILEKELTPRFYEKGAAVYWQGDLAAEFFYLKDGAVRIFFCSENGGEKTLAIRKSGSVFGEAAFFDGLPRVSSAKTLKDSKIIAVTRQSLLKCIRKDPELAMGLLTCLSQTIRMLSSQVDTATFQQADERLARLLLNLAGTRREIRATHEDLAALAGVSRVTASRILSGFRHKGWIQTGYRGLHLTNAAALEKFAANPQKRHRGNRT